MATSRKQSGEVKETRLDDNVTEPSTVAPGDAPADTTDPTERATSVTPAPSDQALKEGTVNAVRKLPATTAERDASKDRWEEYDATRPDGTVVRVRHNLDTGETSVK